jgi:isoleucyl-tRNA synthetase
MQVRNSILKALEEARNAKVIGKSFEAHLTLYPNEEVKNLLDSLDANLQQILIVSKFDISEGIGEYKFDGLSIDVEPASGETCARCWQIVDELNEEELCERCNDVIK